MKCFKVISVLFLNFLCLSIQAQIGFASEDEDYRKGNWSFQNELFHESRINYSEKSLFKENDQALKFQFYSLSDSLVQFFKSETINSPTKVICLSAAEHQFFVEYGWKPFSLKSNLRPTLNFETKLPIDSIWIEFCLQDVWGRKSKWIGGYWLKTNSRIPFFSFDLEEAFSRKIKTEFVKINRLYFRIKSSEEKPFWGNFLIYDVSYL